MKLIFKCLTLLSLPALLLASLPVSNVVAQEGVEESVEQLADEIGEAIESWVEENDIEEIGEEVGQALEKWLKENSEELEAWSKEHGDRWEAWAGRFERNMNRWAKSHERDWNNWSKEYSDRLEAWSRKLESDELSAGQLGKLIENNIEMLSDIPLGKLIDGALKEGLSQLEDAPWDSIDDLQSMIRRSLEQSVDKAEELAERVDRLNAKERPARQRGGNLREDDLKFLLPVDGRQQRGNESNRSELKTESDDKRKELQALLDNKNTDWEDVEKIIAEMRKLKKEQRLNDRARSAEHEGTLQQKREAANERIERARAARKEAIEKARRSAEDRLAGRSGAQRQSNQDRETTRAKTEEARTSQERRLEALANRLVKTIKVNGESRESLQKLYKQLALKEQKIDEEQSEIEEMKSQLQKLAKEIEELKKNK